MATRLQPLTIAGTSGSIREIWLSGMSVRQVFVVLVLRTIYIWDDFSLSVPLFPFQVCGDARKFVTASSASRFHHHLYPVFFFQSSPSPAFFTSLLTQSSHLNLVLPHLLLPCSRNSAGLFGSLSSAILSTCPADINLLLASIYVELLCTPVSSVNATTIRMYALVTLAIFRTQLFSHTCRLCCCSSVSAKVSVP